MLNIPLCVQLQVWARWAIVSIFTNIQLAAEPAFCRSSQSVEGGLGAGQTAAADGEQIEREWSRWAEKLCWHTSWGPSRCALAILDRGSDAAEDELIDCELAEMSQAS